MYWRIDWRQLCRRPLSVYLPADVAALGSIGLSIQPFIKPSSYPGADHTAIGKKGIKVKKEGKYGADTAYTKFINWLMNPDPTKRPSAKEALNHPFLKDRMLDDDSAKDAIKALVSERKKDPNAPEPKSLRLNPKSARVSKPSSSKKRIGRKN